MKTKKYLFGILSLLTMAVIIQEPLIAAKQKVYAASDLAAS